MNTKQPPAAEHPDFSGVLFPALAMMTMLASINASAASFDCRRASSSVEKQICADPTLSKQDSELSTVYSQLKNQPDWPSLKASQREWIKKRNACPQPSCIAEAQATRLSELKNVPSGSSTPSSSETVTSASRPAQLTPPAPQPPSSADVPVSSDPAIRSVLVTGVGATADSAAVNAVQNALTQVAGSFIDTEQQVSKKTEIEDGIRSEAKTISSQTREYSQGSIERFDILNASQDGPISRVDARVTVRLKDFHAYMTRILHASVALKKGLFASVVAQQEQRENQSGILFDRVLAPLKKNDGFTLTLSEAMDLPEWSAKSNAGAAQKPDEYYLKDWLDRTRRKEGAYQVFPITMEDDGHATKELADMVRHLSDVGCWDSHENPTKYEAASRTLPYERVQFVLPQGLSSSDICEVSTTDSVRLSADLQDLRTPKIELEFFDDKNEIVERYSTKLGMDGSVNSAIYVNGFHPWATRPFERSGIINLRRRQDFLIFAKIPTAVLKSAVKASVTISYGKD